MEQADEWELEQDSGYDIELFVNAPDPEFICTVCHGVLKGPVELCCQHVFCKSCISNWLARKQECPYCRKKVKGVTRSVIPMIHNMIGRLIMKCENKVYGCRYTFPLEQYKNHKAACEFRIVSCRYEGCATEIFHKNITAHEQVCEHWNQPCRMGCGVQLTRNQLEEHNCYRDAKRKYKEKITVLKRRLSCMRRRLKLVEGIVQSLTAGNHVQLLESCVCRDADISGLPTESQEKGGSSNNIFDALEYSENESQYSCNSASTLEKADEPPMEDGSTIQTDVNMDKENPEGKVPQLLEIFGSGII
ncbi:RING finger protein 151 isoform X2 [Pristis pectinata]|uniref:RING finger protein 151 isoform X2 n=1 Tax=Pristis pectinata TaxID=685728 RepID=UPI00223D1F8B|nr:RING finger protein 151 isoform X2 [Pristis pectinata]